MNSTSNRTHHALATLVALGASLLPTLAQIPSPTQAFSRTGKTEVYGIGQYLHSDSVDYSGPSGHASIRMDDTGLGGFGIAYHFNDYLSLHGDFMFGSATFSADLPIMGGGTVNASQDAFIQTGRLNLDYNIINRRLTPFVTAGIGYQYLDTELDRLPPVNTCWWDPWWGYVCSSGSFHASETEFTWNAGVGVRWSVTDTFFVKATAGGNWLEYSGGSGITTQIEGIFSIGWSF
jgi:opacity protein-like surface antigen